MDEQEAARLLHSRYTCFKCGDNYLSIEPHDIKCHQIQIDMLKERIDKLQNLLEHSSELNNEIMESKVSALERKLEKQDKEICFRCGASIENGTRFMFTIPSSEGIDKNVILCAQCHRS